MPSSRRVALIGFGAFEHDALTAYLRLQAGRRPAYEAVDDAGQAEFLLVATDGDGPARPPVAAMAHERVVYVGTAPAPAGAVSWVPRPFDPLWLLRELDVLAALAIAAPAASAPAPVAPPDADDEASTQPMPLDASPSARKALVVDDSEIAQRYLELQLQRLGFAVQRAASSGQASSLLAHTTFDAVFLDIDLGPDSEFDGLALCQQIKRGPLHLGEAPPAVLLVSAHAQPVMRVRAQLVGADGLLAKPLDMDELTRVLAGVGLAEPAPPPYKEHKSRTGPARG